MKDHHLQLNLAKTEMLVVPANPTFHHNFTIQLDTSTITITPSSSSKPVWMCLFCWTQRKVFWRKFVTRLFWGTIDFHSRKKNTMEVNGAPELLCFPHSSEYLPLCSAEQTHSYRFGTTWGRVNDDRIYIFGWTIPLMFAYKTTTVSAPLYLNSLLQTYVPSRSLHSASERRFIVPSQRGTKSLSRTFKLNVPSWWNELNPSSWVLSHLQESAKTHLFHLYLTL